MVLRHTNPMVAEVKFRQKLVTYDIQRVGVNNRKSCLFVTWFMKKFILFFNRLGSIFLQLSYVRLAF